MRYLRFLLNANFWLHVGVAASTVLSVIIFAEALIARSFQAAHLVGFWVLASIVGFTELFVLDFVSSMRPFFTRKVNWTDNDLQELGNRIGIQMGVRSQVRLGIKTKFSNAYYIAGRIIIGDKLLESMSKVGIAGVLAHELAHRTQSHLWKKLIAITASAVPIGLAFNRYSWLPSVIFYPAAMAFLFLLSIPINWWAEFDADNRAAEVLGVETIIGSLLSLKAKHKDELSITHPSISWRIRRLQKKFQQAH